jgi:hypothetical protein
MEVTKPRVPDAPGFGDLDPVRNLSFITCTGD